MKVRFFVCYCGRNGLEKAQDASPKGYATLVDARSAALKCLQKWPRSKYAVVRLECVAEAEPTKFRIEKAS